MRGRSGSDCGAGGHSAKAESAARPDDRCQIDSLPVPMVVSEPAPAVRIISPRRLTATEKRILVYLVEHEGEACTKARIAEAVACNRKTVDRLVSHLREDGFISVEPTYDARGSQLANVYRVRTS